MDEITNVETIETKEIPSVEIPEVKVDVQPSPVNQGIVVPTKAQIGQSMVNTATGIVAGVIINAAIQGTIIVGGKVLKAAGEGIHNFMEARKEKKELKRVEKAAQAAIASGEVEEETAETEEN